MVEHNTAVERMEAVQQKLDEYEGRCGLPPVMAPGTDLELNDYLTMDKNALQSLGIAECANIAYRLAQYSFYITRTLNKERSQRIWAEALLREMVAKANDNYSTYIKYELKVALIANENAFAGKLNKIISYSQQRIQRLEDLANSITFLAKVIMDVRRSKYNKENSYG